MINEQILDFIVSEAEKGIPDDAIIESLVRAGWSLADVEEAFAVLNESVPPPPPDGEYETEGDFAPKDDFMVMIFDKVFKSKEALIVVLVLSCLILLVFSFFSLKSLFFDNVTEVTNTDPTNSIAEIGVIEGAAPETSFQPDVVTEYESNYTNEVRPDESTESAESNEYIEEQAEVIPVNNFPIDLFVSSLARCTPFSHNYYEPELSMELNRKIVGMEEGKCLIVEQMSEGIEMRCLFDPSLLPSVAQNFLAAFTGNGNSAVIQGYIDEGICIVQDIS